MKTIKFILPLLLALVLAACGPSAQQGASDEPGSTQAQSTSEAVGAESADASAETGADTEQTEDNSEASEKVASASEMVEVDDVVEDGMTPITGEEIAEGTYDIVVDSSSSMFNIEACKLTVETGGKMTAVMTMGGKGYLYLYMGTGEEAAQAPESDYIPFEEDGDAHTFTVPVEALDKGISCAAFSKKKEKWYDRTLVFRADSLPMDVFATGVHETAEDLGLADGTYHVEVTLSGGSGRASVESPAELTVKDGACTARIVWSSPNYDYMLVDGEKYLPVNTEGNSVFEIPVAAFDAPLAVKADTTAMSEPHEIDYTLTFSASSIE